MNDYFEYDQVHMHDIFDDYNSLIYECLPIKQYITLVYDSDNDNMVTYEWWMTHLWNDSNK